MIKDYINDLTALGSLPFHIILICCFALAGNYELSLVLLLGIVICYVISVPIKLFYFKQRPNKQSYATLVERFDAASFPSVHTMRAVVVGGVLVGYVDQLLFALFVGLLLIGVMYSRIALKKHFMIDVLAGLIIGLCIVGGLALL